MNNMIGIKNGDIIANHDSFMKSKLLLDKHSIYTLLEIKLNKN